MGRESLLGAALICTTLANINRDTSKRPEPFLVEEFLPSENPISAKPKAKPDEVVDRRQTCLDQWRSMQGRLDELGIKGK